MMIYHGSGGFTTRGEGADRVEELARGSRERRQQRAYAGPADEYIADTGNGQTDFQPGLYRHNTAFTASLDVKTALDVAKPSVVSRILSRSPRTLDGCFVGRNARLSWIRVFENSETEFPGALGAFVNSNRITRNKWGGITNSGDVGA